MESLIETWRINNRIHLFLLNSLTDEQLRAKANKGRAVDAQFAHIHNVRLMWVKAAAPDLLDGLTKLETGLDKEGIAANLNQSEAAISEILVRAGEPNGRVKGFRPHAGAFLGYLLSHESHHRGQVELTLRSIGMPIDDKISYGLWEWGVR